MVKKIGNVFLAAVLIMATCFCGPAYAQEETQSNSEKKSSAKTTQKTESDEMAELSAIGDVQVENGVFTVSVTLPAEFCKDITQEQLDADEEDNYKSAVLNEDGSVTYKMTKAQYKKMMKNISDGLEKSVQEMIEDDDTYSISAVKHNDDYSVFDVTLDGTELKIGDSFTAITFYMYGGVYGIFSGNHPEHIVVNFLDPDGNLIESEDSADMAQ